MQHLIGIKIMKISHLYMAAMALLLGACSETELPSGSKPTEDGLMPVLFSAGNMDAAVTRATVSYLKKDSKFVCSMFFHAGAKDTDDDAFYSDENPLEADVNMVTISQQISDDNGTATSDKTLYWQNRYSHVFLALADNNHLGSSDTITYGAVKAFDLTRGEKNEMSQQPDPILAYVKDKPSGATPEANRVTLMFKHQLAQVQVNIKNSEEGSVNITDALAIDCVELIGVSKTAYVPFSIQSDGTVDAVTADPENDDYAFSMFARTSPTAGYLKTFEGIAFGTMQAIRVTWHETGNTSVKHQAILKSVTDVKLESAHKYIYNIELRRSVIANVTATIADWVVEENGYDAEGTIKN